jgi:hypothetical protein
MQQKSKKIFIELIRKKIKRENDMKNIFFISVIILCSVFSFGQEFKINPLLADTISNRTCVIKDTLGYDSLFQEFYSNGQLFYQMPYRNGLQNGWSEQFHRNGVVWSKSLWIDGKIADGYQVYFGENGTICERGHYKNGHQVGKWYSYTHKGEPLNLRIYNKKGKFVMMNTWNWEKGQWEKCGFY